MRYFVVTQCRKGLHILTHTNLNIMRKTDKIVPKNLFPKSNPIDWSKYIEPKKVVHVKVNSTISVAQLIK